MLESKTRAKVFVKVDTLETYHVLTDVFIKVRHVSIRYGKTKEFFWKVGTPTLLTCDTGSSPG